MEAKILAILKELQPDYDFEEDVDFIERSYLDSFDVVTLVTELEREFSIRLGYSSGKLCLYFSYMYPGAA